MNWATAEIAMMERALQLAVRGEGSVEPNPMVGCVLAREGEIVGEGWHTHFGGPHAEVAALETAGEAARGATAYVTLEPCCHQGKTPPCTEALIAAGVVRVVYALADPSPHVDGGGAAALRAAGVDVASRLLEKEARELCAPYLKRVTDGRPWIIAKWAMSLDGRLATRAGDSQWISGEESRAVVHGLRGRVDAVMVGRGTAVTDDPLLTARPPGPRTATRIVVDSTASLPLESQLVRTASEGPVLVATGATADEAKVAALEAAGCEVFCAAGDDRAARFASLLDELGRREMTNVLVEGGAELLGSLFDARLVDEVHAFIAPKIIGGAEAPAAVGGRGVDLMSAATQVVRPTITTTGDDVYVRGRVVRA